MTFNQAFKTCFAMVLAFLGRAPRTVACSGAISLGLISGGSHAVAKSPLDDTLSICVDKAADFDAIQGKLQTAGWVILDPASASDQDVEKLAWAYALQYLSGNPLDAVLVATLERQKATVRGALKKRDIASFRSRILKRPVGATSDYLVLNWQHPNHSTATLLCNVVLAGHEGEHAKLADTLAAVKQSPEYADLTVARFPNLKLSQRNVQLFVFDWDDLEKRTGSRPPYAVFSTYLETEVSQ
ncbi:hypothetical protein [Tropicibacter sp. Alg240-R139]|uniref:hypothetical protein n=1 Tax=Tropicibacter sp. Alg240-R139 TaxID=2305991 RepID=UPI0013E0D47D|nr:hypothetical protein [Tropicibacter sp. Alg240-R139]